MIVLEQCGALPHSSSPLPAVVKRIRPNRGREAHAFLWYIVHHYHTLKPRVLFLQSDAPRHVKDLPAKLEELRVATTHGDVTFFSLAGTHRPSTYHHGTPLQTFCELYFDVVRVGAAPGVRRPCKLWSSVTWAHFAASREAIRTHTVHFYRKWMRTLERPEASDAAFTVREPVGDALTAGGRGGKKDKRALAASALANATSSATSDVNGATFFERSWSFIFGCARPLGGVECGFEPTETHRALASRCKFYNARLHSKLVLDEPFYSGCRAVHNLTRARVWTAG